MTTKTLWILCAGSVLALAGDPGTNSWPMWGGTPDRNMVSSMKGVPARWDVAKKENIKWVAQLGSQSYGNPTVGGGVVLVGTNNESLKDPKIKGDKGVLMAFKESDGSFMYQLVSDKLAAGRVNDWPYQGVASSPMIEDDRAYYVNNRAEVVCFELQTGKIIWKFDMMEEVGAHPHNLANSSPVGYGDLIYVSTSNGQDESHVHIPSPRAPSIIALNKKTGKLVWEDNSVGEKILHGQWSSPAVGLIGDVVQVVSAQGDGWVRGYEATTGKKLWEFDTNPKDSVWPKTRNELISTPIIQNNRVYISNGQDPEHGEGDAHLYAIDATKRGDITKTGQIWHYPIRRSISTGALHNGILYYADFSGFLHAIDAETGKQIWKHDMLAAVWGSPMVIDGKVYLGDEDGDVVVLEAGRQLKQLFETNMGSSVYCTVVPANGTLFVVNRNQLFAIAQKN
ncbi:MAG: PQQ-binding-like beta-propeller repeat protein [Bryobacteraceae bacterium]|nr:PQQ-binding-like beta-propeller repeat protein [Bryobacteraceae bacterium]